MYLKIDFSLFCTGTGTPEQEHRNRNTGTGTPEQEHRNRNTGTGETYYPTIPIGFIDFYYPTIPIGFMDFYYPPIKPTDQTELNPPTKRN
jgi:hypothetical protein